MPVLKVKKDGVWEYIGGVSGHTHEISEIVDFPSSLPANGGNADTLDGKHASEFALAKKLDGLATEYFVTNKIAEAKLDGVDNVDLSGYATKDDINELSELVGDETVAAQISTAIASKADISSLNYKQDKYRSVQVTLLASGWNEDGHAQAVSASGATQSNVVIVTPAPSNYNEYCESGVYCLSQMKDTLLFLCSETPSIDLTVNVLILN